MKIIVYGAGYVGLANALMLSKMNDVTLVEVNKQKYDSLKKGVNYLDDPQIDLILKSHNLNIEQNSKAIIGDEYELVILALPTNYDEQTKEFDVSLILNQLEFLNESTRNKTVLIKSTIPVGFTEEVSEKFKNLDIIFSPEFLREGNSYYDATNPTRIIVGRKVGAEWVGDLFEKSVSNNPQIIYMGSKEAESVKLFSNTYLAMRVAFVNELDNFSKAIGIESKDIIDGVTLDPRIGRDYFKPSAGYGGYCLPKDSKELQHEFEKANLESEIIPAIVRSNALRRKVIIGNIIDESIKNISIIGLGHKPGVNNYRNSQRLQIAKELRNKGVGVEIVDINFCGEIIEGFEIVEKATNKHVLDDFIG